MARHERRHNGNKPFSCYICTKTFYETYDLKRHMRRTHQISEHPETTIKETQRPCVDCGKELGTNKRIKECGDTNQRKCVKCFKLRWFNSSSN